MLDKLQQFADRVRNRPTNLGIQPESFKILDSSKIQLEPHEVSEKKQAILDEMEKIGVDQLNSLFASAVSEIFLNRNFRKNQKLVKTFFRAADFVKDKNQSYVKNFQEIILKKYEDVLTEVKLDLTPDEFQQFEGYLAAWTIMEMADKRNHQFKAGEVIDKVGSFFPNLTNRTAKKS